MSKKLEKTNSGVKKEGDLEDIAEFSEDVKDAMSDGDVKEDSVKDFDSWRPKKNDDEENIREKTVKNASMSEKKSEKQSEGLKKDFSKAGKAVKDAGKKIENGENPQSKLKKVPKRVFRPFNSISVKTMRNLEEKVYRSMTRFNPYFFDADEFSADLKKSKGSYVMDVNVPDEKHRNNLKEEMGEK